ncbi:hypothetical protein G7Z99_02505 [Pseudomonas entomophila]|uniref:hypothetical protein n=1 Tax=Pseudomonas entomophila TaxID=312306 RepID=UPI0015E3257D|nr:hypothetical protein [Pseudomonas entomophila]MBA1187911.1 hypothetical protein [Pseudomonas entomophila]
MTLFPQGGRVSTCTVAVWLRGGSGLARDDDASCTVAIADRSVLFIRDRQSSIWVSIYRRFLTRTAFADTLSNR